MTCREASNLLPLFFDGELDARQMRAVAMHSTRCNPCETALREIERLQEVVSVTVNARVEEIDLSRLWTTIEPRLVVRQPSWWERVRARWPSASPWSVGIPAFAAAAAIAVLAFLFLAHSQQPAAMPPAAPQMAAVDNAASIDSLDADVESVTVLNDPETRTTVLWVSDDTSVGDVP
jgi:anti-sigma-K factor RskA